MKPRNSVGLIAIGLLLGAVPLMLWLGRWKHALAYVVIGLIVVAGLLAANWFGPPWPPSWNAMGFENFVLAVGVGFSIIGILHALHINSRAAIRPWYSRWYIALVAPTAIGVGLAFAIRLFLFQPFSTPSESGFPNLLVGDYIMVSKSAYQTHDPQRGDIAVFKLPSNPEIDYIKRVVGLPGDRIQMVGGVLFINGEAVKLELVELQDLFKPEPGMKFFRETLPGGRSYVIADLAETNADNTEEYVVPPGHYFTLGDNRDNSQDSRFLDYVGFIPRENFIGRYSFHFWNDNAVPLADRPSETMGQ